MCGFWSRQAEAREIGNVCASARVLASPVEKIKNLKIDNPHVCTHRSGISVIVAAGMQNYRYRRVWIEHVGWCTTNFLEVEPTNGSSMSRAERSRRHVHES